MHKRHLITYVLTLTCCILLMPDLGTAQSDRVKSEMTDLKAETGKFGAPKVQSNDLYFGSVKADNSTVDAVVKKDGGAATLFVKNKDQYVRVATTLNKAEGSSAVGTALDANSPAVAKLNGGAAYYGDTKIFGKNYDAGYEPIMDASGAVIGAYFVGYQK
jgi:Cache 3/Cache 2 fusion domain